MKNKPLSLFSWRLALVVLTLLALVYGVWASLYWERAAPAEAGTLAASFGSPDADLRRPILSMEADSPLIQVGAKLGDRVRFDRNIQMHLGINEFIGLTLFSGDRHSHLSVQPIRDKEITAHPITAELNVACNLAAAFCALMIALLIGLRRGDNWPMRVFALLLFGGIGVDKFNLFVPDSAFTDAVFPFLRTFGFASGYLLFTLFALTYPEDRPFWRLKPVRRAYYVYLACFLVYIPFRIAGWMGYAPEFVGSPTVAGMVNAATRTLALGSVLGSLVPLTISWSRSTGVTRQRLGWIGVSMGSIYAVWLLMNLNRVMGSPFSDLVMDAADGVVSLLALAGFAYALLRHRLFDFGFAMNRALVVTIISSLLLVVFSITEWGVDKLLHFEGREKNVVFDALVALGVILSFHRIQHWVNHQVDHTFFHHWYQAAEKLRRFLDMTAHISDPDALRNKFAQAVTQFSDSTGVAIYARQPNGCYDVTCSTFATAPTSIDANHDVVIELAYAHRMVDLTDRPILPCELVFPMTVRGRVEGMVLFAQRRNGKGYRPDQIELLAAGVHQLGMDLESLRVIELEQGISKLQKNMELLECENAALWRASDNHGSQVAS